MKNEIFITEVEIAAEKIKNKLIQGAHVDWVEQYSRMDLSDTQSKEIAIRWINHFMLEELYLQSSKNLLK